MLWLKLNHASKRGPSRHSADYKITHIFIHASYEIMMILLYHQMTSFKVANKIYRNIAHIYIYIYIFITIHPAKVHGCWINLQRCQILRWVVHKAWPKIPHSKWYARVPNMERHNPNMNHVMRWVNIICNCCPIEKGPMVFIDVTG